MDFGLPLNPNEMQNEDDAVDGQKMQQPLEFDKIGNFDVDSWKKIFKHLSTWDLANVSVVCKSFQKIARHVFLQRTDQGVEGQKFHKSVNFLMERNKWKTILCRFRNEIPSVFLQGPPVPKNERVFHFIIHFLHNTLENLAFARINANQFKNIVTRRHFSKLNSVTFTLSNLNHDCDILNKIASWGPQLKILKFSHTRIGRSKILEQSIPSLEELSLHGVSSITDEKLLVFIVKNRQLKRLYVQLDDVPSNVVMSCLPVVNELLINLESLGWKGDDMDLLQTNFRQNFANLKDFAFVNNGIYTNQLMKIIKYLPVIEELRVIHSTENLMSNDHLIELFTEASSTLTKLHFSSRGWNQELKFGYHLHRRICSVTSNRSNIHIEIEFGIFDFSMLTRNFVITKDWIKQNGNLIVLKGLLS